MSLAVKVVMRVAMEHDDRKSRSFIKRLGGLRVTSHCTSCIRDEDQNNSAINKQ